MYLCTQIDMDKLSKSLPLHLTRILIFSRRDEAVFKHVLRGVRLLHSLCDLAPRIPKFDQVSSNNPYDLININCILILVVFTCACLLLFMEKACYLKVEYYRNSSKV